jgi:membrane protease YdiL (CAAX protease family)
MMNKQWGITESAILAWATMAFVLSILAKIYFQGSFPIFTMSWLIVPLLIVIRTHDAHQVGIRQISWQKFLSTTAINLALLLVISFAVEPWSHTYQALVHRALSSTPPDTTFAWLVRFKGLTTWAGLLLYSGLVTIFAEELFFRGWLSLSLQGRIGKAWAIIIQAALFTILQSFAAFLLSPAQGVIYALVYSFLGVGIVGGWAAARTRSIWPSLASATIWNLIMIAKVR